jgi:hypothetical protein
MKKRLQAEEFAQLAIAILGLYIQPIHISWWIWPFVFLSPDISMLGYLVNTRIGAISYNLFHHKLIAILIVLLGYCMHNDLLLFSGILLFAHSSFDRAFGYGLKYNDSFQHTHLGMIGKARDNE